MRRGLRRRRFVVAAVAVVAVLAWSAYVAVSLLGARAAVRRGLDAVDAARSHLDPSSVAQPRAVADLRSGRAEFARAYGLVSRPLLAPATLVPVGGRQLRSARALSRTAVTLSDVGIRGISESTALFRTKPSTGAARLRLVEGVVDLTTQLRNRLATVRLGPSRALVGPLARARAQVAADVARLDDDLARTRAASAAAAAFLRGPSRYLLVATNNAEMRAGSAMFLEIGELETHGGALHLTGMRPVTDVVVPPGVPIDDHDLDARWAWKIPNQEWRDLMMSPRFAASASLCARMWKAATGRAVDGVLAVDVVGLSEILDATGPVHLGDRTVSADTVVTELLHGQYVHTGDDTRRHELLGELAAQVFGALDAGSFSPRGLAHALADAAGGRHLFAWSSVAPQQAGWRAAGIDGSMTPTSLLVSVENRGGNKMDPLLDVHAALELRSAGGHTDGVLTVRVRNTTEVAREPADVTGPYPGSGLRAGEYPGIVVVNLPRAAVRATMDGIPQLAVAGPDGPTLTVGTTFVLGAGQSHSWVVRFRLAVAHGDVRVEPSARVPATRWLYHHQEWRDDRARIVLY